MGFRVKYLEMDGAVTLQRAGGHLAGSPLRDEAPTLEWAKAIVSDLCREFLRRREETVVWIEDADGVRVHEQRTASFSAPGTLGSVL